MLVSGIAEWYYHESGLYGKDHGVGPGPTVPWQELVVNMALVSILLIGAKYLVYLFLCLPSMARTNGAERTVWQVIIFGILAIAIYIDYYAVFLSSEPQVDSGFVILAVLFYSPPLLVIGMVLILSRITLGYIAKLAKPTFRG